MDLNFAHLERFFIIFAHQLYDKTSVYNEFEAFIRTILKR